MRLTIKAKQVVGVTSIVGLAVVGLGGLYVSAVARVRLEASQAAGELLANAIYHRARAAAAGSRDPYAALRADPGLRSILESSAYSPNVTYAAVVDPSNVAIAHGDGERVGHVLPARPGLDTLLAQGAWAQLRTIYAGDVPTLEIQRPLLMGDRRFGTIRIGVSMLLTRADVDTAIRPAVLTAVAAVIGASLVAMLLAQSLLRPIHLLRAGLSRLGRGEFGVTVDVTGQDELGDLGGFFNSVSAQLSAERAKIAGDQPVADLAAQFEDAVACVGPGGRLLFANHAMRALLPSGSADGSHAAAWPAGHPLGRLVAQTMADGEAKGPVAVGRGAAEESGFSTASGDGRRGDLVASTHPIRVDGGPPVGVLLVARDLGHLAAVQGILKHARRHAALSRLSAGVAHELKNPLNAMSIHLALLAQQIGEPAGTASIQADTPPLDRQEAAGHVDVIGAALRRLDEVLQGYFKFTRPDELKLQPVSVPSVLDEVLPVVRAEARRSGVDVRVECPADLPLVPADAGMLQQAILNLALNACQAMPGGGRLGISARAVPGRQVEIAVEDSGPGIAPENLDRVFDLYFTTRPEGSGMGLAFVYRTIRLHDGDIEVDSSPGTGTVFRVLLPQS